MDFPLPPQPLGTFSLFKCWPNLVNHSFRDLYQPFVIIPGFIELSSVLVSRSHFYFLLVCLRTCLSILFWSLFSRSFLPLLHSIHILSQLLANPSANPVKQCYAVSSYLGWSIHAHLHTHTRTYAFILSLSSVFHFSSLCFLFLFNRQIFYSWAWDGEEMG